MTAFQRPSRDDLRAAYAATKSIRGVAKLFLLPGSKTKHVSHETARRWLAAAGIKVRGWKYRS